jgi:hypothetical protein
MKVDCAVLSRCCQACFSLAMDGRLEEDQQRDFGAMGKILRGHLLNLLTAEFEEGTAAVLQANKDLGSLNRKLQQCAQNLDKIASTLEAAASLAASLEKLLSVASLFV